MQYQDKPQMTGRALSPAIKATILCCFLCSIVSLAAGQSAQGPSLPGPDPLWFLGPLSPTSRGPSSSMEARTFDLGWKGSTQNPIKLRIPEAYIAQVSQPDQRRQSYVTLVVYLPDYLPRFLADQAGFQTRGPIVNGIELRSRAEIAITARATVHGSLKKFIDQIERDNLFGGTYENKFKTYYQVYQKSADSPRVPRKESGYFIPHEDENIYLSFSANLTTNQLLGCAMYFEYEGLELEVIFTGNHLQEYAIIKERAAELIKPFLQK